MSLVEQYIRDLVANRATGATVAETTHYPALQKLLDGLGAELKPKVRCITGLSNQGAGMPDGGLFTAAQFRQQEGDRPQDPTNPERGVIEAKGIGANVRKTARSSQVHNYWLKYRQVLVTNFREFLLVGCDGDGEKVELEFFSLAKTEAEFWQLAENPRALATQWGQSLTEYLQRAMLSTAAIASPEDVAWFLASYARDARVRIEQQPDLPALQMIRESFETALGIHFEAERGDRFFRSTLVQTLFYGIFSAWVLWHREGSKGEFAWERSWRFLRVPILQMLFHRLSDPETLELLGLIPILDGATAALNRVNRSEFFSTFDDSQAVQYFYEPFLQAFDPDLRKELGVWYTPPEVVRYMVARVDRVLREELNCADGLASEEVYILDPCCGTGAYLVAVIEHIAATLRAKSEDSGLGSLETSESLKEIVLKRVFGFEILTAPFVVAHLQVSLLLHKFGESLLLYGKDQERVGIFLTNALTGWRQGEPLPIPNFPALERERDAAESVKKSKPILVVLGNPPYNSFAGIAVDEERELSDAYRETKHAPRPQGQGLNDLYVRFFRMAERRIVEQTERGIVCFISNYSWLDGLSFTGMRERYLEVFDRVWIDNLHGDRIISEYSPDGRTSETVFAIPGFSAGIRVGTAIALLMKGKKSQASQIFYRDFDQARAVERCKAMAESLTESKPNYQEITSSLTLGLPLKPKTVTAAYFDWPLLTDLLPISFPGVKTSRDSFLVDIDKKQLELKIQEYFDRTKSDGEIERKYPIAMKETRTFNPKDVRKFLLSQGIEEGFFVEYLYRPFDKRWLYWEPNTDLLDRKRTEYLEVQRSNQNLWLAAAQKHRRDFDPPCISGLLTSGHVIERGANLFPLKTPPDVWGGLFQNGSEHVLGDGEFTMNYSPNAIAYLRNLSLDITSEALFFHCVAILYSLQYRTENGDALKQDWPRIPLPNHKKHLQQSAQLGQQLAALLDPETPVPGVTQTPSDPLKIIAVPLTTHGEKLKPEDFALTANWGYGGNGKPTMPGKGKAIQRPYTPTERDTLGSERIARLGEHTYDIYLNDRAYWCNIPDRVWHYTLGGYQVIKKWLSYRAEKIIDRPLKQDEFVHVIHTARRLAAILILEPDLDANYHTIKTHLHPWKSEQGA
ncbi:type ISP restriction/modification enzyme [Spirulina major]|uniref:type ISP restriction/modification enzyme n=1 Tax=Spirulina major TaxID=270636 RepID=UPI0009325F9F|nr:type ISP restriction/modification enzyme [Spirulina major]